jgi:hypothetical protein
MRVTVSLRRHWHDTWRSVVGPSLQCNVSEYLADRLLEGRAV